MKSTSTIYVKTSNVDCQADNADCQTTSTENYTECEQSHLHSHLMLPHSEKTHQVLTKKTLSKSPSGTPKGRKGVSGGKGGNGGYRGQKTAVAGDGGFEFRYPLICEPIKNNKFLVDRAKMRGDFTGVNNITVPLAIDTEFTTEPSENYQQKGRTLITTQIKGIHKDAPAIIYAHHPAVNEGRAKAGLEPCLKPSTLFDVADYLRDVGGCEVSIREASSTLLFLKKLPKFTAVLYGHFLTAEINMIFSGSLKTYIKQLQRSKGEDQIISGRRLYCQSFCNGQKSDTVSLKHIITIDDVDFELCLKLVDTGALHGIASYAAIADAVGHELPFKKLFTDDEKGRWLDMVKERALDAENYSTGDLDAYEILEKYDVKWREVYEILGLSNYYREPKLTIGGSVKDLFEAALACYFQLEPKNWVDEFKKIIDEFIQPGSADELRKWVNFTSALLSKVEGGRCRNNRPIELSIKNVFTTPETQLTRKRQLKEKLRLYGCILVDLDVLSCYGEGQRNQDYPIGKPEIFHYKHSSNNEYITLREWLLAHDVKLDNLIKAVENKDKLSWIDRSNMGELVPGLWHMRVNNKNPLLYPQDLIASWFLESSHGTEMLAKTLSEMKCDTEMLTTENTVFDEDTGSLKIFNHDIKNGLLNHNCLQWILTTSKRQRNELLDNLVVLCSMVYPKSSRIDVTNGKEGLAKLREAREKWTGKNTTQRIKDVDGKTSIVMNFREYHGWFSVNLGDLLVDKLLIERKKAKIVHGEKTPLDILFKLCVNTLYGDMVSKYFVTSNPTVGNNITARARMMAWYMEKGLDGRETITDGCGYQPNKVLYPGRDSINGECVNLYREGSKLAQRKIKRDYLGGKKLGAQWVDLIIDGKPFDCRLIESIDGKPFLDIDGEKVECCPQWINKVKKANSESPIDRNSLKKTQKPYLIDEDGGVIENSMEWLNEMSMKHLQDIFPLVDVLHEPSTALTVDKKTLEVKRLPRIGQFSFEVKDIYHSGAFHGTANYAFENPNGLVIKARGYETKREHIGIELDPEQDDNEFLKSDRYGAKNNPAKDLMKQILENPESITRQIPAIKSGILKVGDYKNYPDRYDNSNIEPGDNINKVVLMKEFSLSQFTYQTLEQYISWKKPIEKAREKHNQSLEGFFLNNDGTLNLQALCEWVDGAIARGVMNPFSELKDKNRHDRRTEKTVKTQKLKTEKRGRQLKAVVTIDHPHLETITSLKAQLNNPPD